MSLMINSKEAYLTHCPLCGNMVNKKYGLYFGDYWGVVECCSLSAKLIDGKLWFVIIPPNQQWHEMWANENKMDEETLKRYAKLRSFE